ncbi:hypothetical protein PENDEC_c021G01802 [Penicillium decumbens]|uniref:Uncharacterized protein n=1 Tax=Penicillium decumbens TaxID=69771 RepID=A0A1V6P5Z5_PENDC|nr:hypothetical protein PENDEC_c021G01802 [Penicillium decumbens]
MMQLQRQNITQRYARVYRDVRKRKIVCAQTVTAHAASISALRQFHRSIKLTSCTAKMAIDSKDLDGDSEMASSIDSLLTDSDGNEAGARTPTIFTHTPAAASKLSPPGSQQQIPDNPATVDPKEVEGNAAQKTRAGSEQHLAPWQTKRAQEDYQRAMEHVVDKDFNLHEFGDPFDERDLDEKLL